MIEGLNRFQAALDGRKVLERCQDPSLQPAGAGGSPSLVEHGKEAELSASVLEVGDKLQVPL